MLISKVVEIELHGKSIARYNSLGYDIPRVKTRDGLRVKRGTKVNVNIEDVPKNSHVLVVAKCDYCGREYDIRYDAYNRQIKKCELKKSACIDCRGDKNKDLNQIRYGVDNQFQRDYVKNKTKETMIEKYGVEHPAYSYEINNKKKNTLYKNQSAPVSSQQLEIYSIIGGKLNYSDDTTGNYNLDIGFPENKVYLEYDGGGHDLCVKVGEKTREQFTKDEIKRSYFLRRRGWKESRIISKKDIIPVEEKLLKIKEKIFYELIENDESFIIFDIDNEKVIMKDFECNLNEIIF